MTTLTYKAYVSWQARGADKVSRYLAWFLVVAGKNLVYRVALKLLNEVKEHAVFHDCRRNKFYGRP